MMFLLAELCGGRGNSQSHSREKESSKRGAKAQIARCNTYNTQRDFSNFNRRIDHANLQVDNPPQLVRKGRDTVIDSLRSRKREWSPRPHFGSRHPVVSKLDECDSSP